MKKRLKKLLSKENIFLDLKSCIKKDIIEEIIDRLFSSGMITNKEKVLLSVMEREKKMTTGMEHGIALPHGKTDAVNDLVVAIGLKKEGVDFDCIDHNPAKIFIMTVSPLSHTGPHIQFLAEVSKLLKDPNAREQLLSAKTEEEVIRVFV